MKVLRSRFLTAGWESWEVGFPSSAREQNLSQILKNLNPSKLLLLLLSPVEDGLGRCCDGVSLKAVRMLLHERGTEHPLRVLALGQLLISRFLKELIRGRRWF